MQEYVVDLNSRHPSDLVYADMIELDRVLRVGVKMSKEVGRQLFLTGGAIIDSGSKIGESQFGRECRSYSWLGWNTHFIRSSFEMVSRDYRAHIYIEECKKLVKQNAKPYVLYYGQPMPQDQFKDLQKSYNLDHYSYLVNQDLEVIENPVWFEEEDHLRLRY